MAGERETISFMKNVRLVSLLRLGGVVSRSLRRVVVIHWDLEGIVGTTYGTRFGPVAMDKVSHKSFLQLKISKR